MSLVSVIAVYVLIGCAAGLMIRFLSWIPILGLLVRLVGVLVEFYVWAGAILAVLDYLDLLKK